MFVHLFCFLFIPQLSEIIDHLSFSELCHLTWYSLGPSMLLQMARFQWFRWLSNVSLYIYCAVLCLVIQLCPILCDTVDCSPPGSSVHVNSPDKNTGVDYCALLQGIFPTQESNWGLLHCRQILYQLSYQEVLYIYYIFFIHSSVHGHLGCFHNVVILWCYEHGVHVSFLISVFVFFW